MTNDDLVDDLIGGEYLKTPRFIEAFRKVDRQNFVPSNLKESAYHNEPLPIGSGQTISQPLTVAFMIEKLSPEEGDRVLDIGFGSGWTAVILSQIVGKGGVVFGVEVIPDVFKFGKSNIEKYSPDNVRLFNQSGWSGLSKEAPFNRILASAAAPYISRDLCNQLKDGGRLVIPVASGGDNRLHFSQSIKLIERAGDKFEEEDYPGFAFVPLVKSD